MLCPELPVWPHIQPFLWLVSVCHCCRFPSICYLFWLPFLVRVKFPVMHEHPGWALSSFLSHRCSVSFPPEGYVTNHWKLPQSHTQFTLTGSPLPFRKTLLLTCHCYAVYLKHFAIYSSLLPVKDCGGYELYPLIID